MLYLKVNFFSFLASIAFLLSSTLLFSQDQNFAFSAYANFAISNEQVQNWHPQGIEVKKGNGASGYFSPAVLIYEEEGNFQEFEISRIGFSTKNAEIYSLDSLNRFTRLVGGTSVDEINVALRYTYSFLIDLFEEESKLRIYLGASASPYFQSESMRPQTADIFPVSSSTAGIRLSAIPSLTYSISEHWFLNLNIPVTVANAFVSSSKTENPVVPISDRKLSNSDIKFFPNELHIRFGLGLRI